MKRTKIKYKVLKDGSIYLEAIENVASFNEIVDEFGASIAEIYASNIPHYFRVITFKHKPVTVSVYQAGRSYPTEKLMAGKIVSSGYFSKAIAGLKESGRAFQKIRSDYDESEIREVVI